MPLFLKKRAFRNLMSICGLRGHGAPAGVPAAEPPAKIRTPEEAKARKKAYKRRKAAKAARRRNRK